MGTGVETAMRMVCHASREVGRRSSPRCTARSQQTTLRIVNKAGISNRILPLIRQELSQVMGFLVETFLFIPRQFYLHLETSSNHLLKPYGWRT